MKKAVVIATGESQGQSPLSERYPAPLLPLLDRPFIQHVVEWFVEKKIFQFEFILSHLPEKIQELLGSGVRWGSTFRFNLARDSSKPYKLLKVLELDREEEPFLLIHADRLPAVNLRDAGARGRQGLPFVFCHRQPGSRADDLEWTGWAVLSGAVIGTLELEGDERSLGSQLMDLARRSGGLIEVGKPLSARSFPDLLDAQRRVLTDEFVLPLLSGRETDKGIRVARNVRLHRRARLSAPVYIGENSMIGADVQLGPNAVVGKDSIVEASSTIKDSLIFPGSYVGESLELNHAIVDKNCLINTQLGATVWISDDFILGGLTERRSRPSPVRPIAQLAAWIVLFFTSTISLALLLWSRSIRGGLVLTRKDFVELPAPPNETAWHIASVWSFASRGGPERKAREASFSMSDFFLRFLPGLLSVAKGKLAWVGVTPRTKEEIQALPADWRALYLQSKAGLVTEALALYGFRASVEELRVCETYYAVNASPAHDLKILTQYGLRLLTASTGPPKASS